MNMKKDKETPILRGSVEPNFIRELLGKKLYKKIHYQRVCNTKR